MLLNKTALDFFVYSGIGWIGGALGSVFFKRSRKFIRALGAGVGSGYAFNMNKNIFNNLRE